MGSRAAAEWEYRSQKLPACHANGCRVLFLPREIRLFDQTLGTLRITLHGGGAVRLFRPLRLRVDGKAHSYVACREYGTLDVGECPRGCFGLWPEYMHLSGWRASQAISCVLKQAAALREMKRR